MTATKEMRRPLRVLDEPFEQDSFLRTMLRHLAGTLQDVVGLKEAAGFVTIVSQRMGEEIERSYRESLGKERLSREEVAAVLIDLKRRIRGDFYLVEESDERLVLQNRACPFGDKVVGRSSLCMMTSNVFGYICAENLGYAKVAIERSIAEGHAECRIVVYLRPSPEADVAQGREYLGP